MNKGKLYLAFRIRMGDPAAFADAIFNLFKLSMITQGEVRAYQTGTRYAITVGFDSSDQGVLFAQAFNSMPGFADFEETEPEADKEYLPMAALLPRDISSDIIIRLKNDSELKTFWARLEQKGAKT